MSRRNPGYHWPAGAKVRPHEHEPTEDGRRCRDCGAPVPLDLLRRLALERAGYDNPDATRAQLAAALTGERPITPEEAMRR